MSRAAWIAPLAIGVVLSTALLCYLWWYLGWYPAREAASELPGQNSAVANAQPRGDAAPALTSGAATSQPMSLGDAQALPWQHTWPPRTRVPVRLEPQKSGIRCPDGTYLPLLNGVPFAPPISRSTRAVALTPVVELVVDDTGCQWFVHADGSATTSRWVEFTDAHGVKSKQVVTDHNEVVPGEFGLNADGTPVKSAR